MHSGSEPPGAGPAGASAGRRGCRHPRSVAFPRPFRRRPGHDALGTGVKAGGLSNTEPQSPSDLRAVALICCEEPVTEPPLPSIDAGASASVEHPGRAAMGPQPLVGRTTGGNRIDRDRANGALTIGQGRCVGARLAGHRAADPLREDDPSRSHPDQRKQRPGVGGVPVDERATARHAQDPFPPACLQRQIPRLRRPVPPIAILPTSSRGAIRETAA